MVDNKLYNTVISYIEKYYNIKLSERDANDLKVQIENDVVTGLVRELPKQFNVRHKGKIVKCTLANIQLLQLMYMRDSVDKEEFTIEDWENIFLDVSDNFVYCEDNQKLYTNIDDDIAEYLAKHNLSENIYNIVSGVVNIPSAKGETAQIYGMYIKKEKSITAKKYLIASNEDLNERVGLNVWNWAFYYIEKEYLSNKPWSRNFENQIADRLHKTALYNNIVEEDLIYRYMHGMSLTDAIDMGIQDSQRYGFKYYEGQNNNNFISYIRYLIKEESKQA